MKVPMDQNDTSRLVAVVDSIIGNVKADFQKHLKITPQNESYKLIILTIEQEILDALKRIRSQVEDGLIIPDIPVRLSITDQKLPVSSKKANRYNIGFLATTGDPLTWNHILTGLQGMADYNLNTVIIQVMGDHPHKIHQKQPTHHRHAIARKALEYFYPLLRYTPLGHDNLKIGEENAAELLLLNYTTPIHLFFLVGDDVSEKAIENMKACRTLLSVMEDERGWNSEITLVVTRRGDISEDFQKPLPEWVDICKKEYRDLPKIDGIRISSSLFRAHPEIPLLPFQAYEYIRQHNLYASRRNFQIKSPADVKEVVVLSYLVPSLHQILEKRIEDAKYIPPLIPYGSNGMSGLLGSTRITVFKAAGKETAILPVMQCEKTKVIIAIGLAGGLQTWLHPGDIILPTAAVRGDGVTSYWADPKLLAIPDFALIDVLNQSAKSLSIPVHCGPLYTTASLAKEKLVLARYAPIGVLGIEMELALHLMLATLHNKKAAGIYTVSDWGAGGEDIFQHGINETPSLLNGLSQTFDLLEDALRTFGDSL